MNKNRCILEKNGLELIELGSEADDFGPMSAGELDEFVAEKMPGESVVAAWLDYKVLIGRRSRQRNLFCENETFENRHVRRMRIFTPEKELLIWRTRDGFRARVRIDDLGGKGTFAVVAKQALYGTAVAECPDENFSLVVETRGSRIALPFKNVRVDDKKQRVFVETRNYVDVNAAGQCQYADCAFVRFTYVDKAL